MMKLSIPCEQLCYHLTVSLTIAVCFLCERATSLRREEGLFSKVITGKAIDIVQDTFETVVTTWNTCAMKKAGWKDPVLGDFTELGEYCDTKCGRSFPVCCLPQRVEELQVQFILSLPPSKETSAGDSLTDSIKIKSGRKKGRNLLRSTGNSTVVILVHGFLNHYMYEDMWNDTAIAYLERGSPVILVDWSKGNRLYNQATANVRVVGALIGQLIKYMGIEERALCVGFSLGAHICGEAGKWLKERHLQLDRCHGIDPAGPGYDGCSKNIRLDASDCGTVTVLHTSQYVDIFGFGTKFKTGHCDFWMNQALEQPDCTDNPSFGSIMRGLLSGKVGELGQTLESAVGCAHVRAMKYYLSQVTGDCNFVGRQVTRCGEGKTCSPLSPLISLDSAIMSLPPDDLCKHNSTSDFVVETTGREPFC